MKNKLTIFFLLIAAYSFGQSSYSRYTDVVPAAGHTITFHSGGSYPPLCQVISVNTAGSAVNLGGNAYTLTYDSLPDKMEWTVYCDFHQLTYTAASQITIFGVTPLVDWPTADTFSIHYVVLLNAGVKKLWYNYVSPTVQVSGVVNGNVTYSGRVTYNGKATFTATTTNSDTTYQNAPIVYKLGNPRAAGQTVITSDTAGDLNYGCISWCTNGNAGLGGTKSFVGTTDTTALNFRSNNVACGSIGVNTTTTTYGYQAGQSITSISGNTAIGYQADLVATSANNNTYIGSSAGIGNSSGSANTGIGEAALSAVTTGGSNTAIGTGAGVTTGALSSTTAIGTNATVSGNNGIALGANATAIANQLTLNGIRSISIPGMTSAQGYALVDTSAGGNGAFVPQPFPNSTGSTFTPVTGDSIAIVNSKNTINPSGTLANLTIILPANPISWKSYDFTFMQIISTLHISIRLSGGSFTSLPTSRTQYSTFGCYYDPNAGGWIISHN